LQSKENSRSNRNELRYATVRITCALTKAQQHGIECQKNPTSLTKRASTSTKDQEKKSYFFLRTITCSTVFPVSMSRTPGITLVIERTSVVAVSLKEVS